MTRARLPFEVLIAGLHGHVLTPADWQAVIALANRTLLSPTLFAALSRSGQIEQLPADAARYLLFLYDCNRQRNLRLRRQLNDTVAALNRDDIVPILLKGAVPLFRSTTGSVALPERIIADIDIAVASQEAAAAEASLTRIGYVRLKEARGMARPHDAGVLELRASRASGESPPDIVESHGLWVRVPSVQARAMHRITHDLLKEGDYLRGRIDLRHLLDLAELAEHGGIDWAALRARLPGRGARNALDTQLLALNRFFDVPVPAQHVRRIYVRFQYWRRVFPIDHPLLGAPLRLAGNVAWGVHKLLRQDRSRRHRGADLARRAARVLLGADLRSKL